MADSDNRNDGETTSGTTVRTRQFLKPTPYLPMAFWRRKWFRVTATTLFILLPIIPYVVYKVAGIRSRVTSITTGPGGGRHEQLESNLRQWLKEQLNVTARPVASNGSLENIRLLQVGQADFTIYQTGTENTLGAVQFDQLDIDPADDRLTPNEIPLNWQKPGTNWKQLDKDRDGTLTIDEFRDLASVRFVANLFSEVIHILVRADSPIRDAGELRGKRVAVGTSLSGDYAMSLLLLEHLGMEQQDITARKLAFRQIQVAFTTDDPEQQIDAAIMSAGLGAPQVATLIEKTGCRVIPVPRVDALTTWQVLLTPAVIPAGLYRSNNQGDFVPQVATNTVAARAQLLAHVAIDPLLVRQVTRTVLNDAFQQENRLVELYTQDLTNRRRFAQTRAEFPVHSGAKAYYDPTEFDAGIFEGWEALYSLIASSLLALFVLARWLVQQNEKRRGHRLDYYLGKILDIEQRQLKLDSEDHRNDSQQLQQLLDEVTLLRQQALRESSAYDLKDDPAQGCFLQMCHYISEKINAKLLRQRLDHRFQELRNVLTAQRE